MLGLPTRNLDQADWQRYPHNCERTVELLAQLCGLEVEAERERFAWCRERLGIVAEHESEDLVHQVTKLVTAELPLIFEMVLTLAGGGPCGFAYMTQGRPSSMPQTLAGLLKGSLQLCLESGGDAAEAELLADLFANSFPNLAGLERFSAMAQGMIVAVVPAGERIKLKVYFNTRLDPSGDHRQRVMDMLACCGLDDSGLYDGLYANVEGARFQGVGVDLDGDGKRRAKLYVHLRKEKLEAPLAALSTQVGDEQTVIAPIRAMVAAFESHMADDIELAVALSEGVATTAKATVFFPTDGDAPPVLEYLDSTGYAVKPIEEMLVELSRGKSPVHGIGIEVPVGEQPKLNLYLQPPL